MIFGSALAVALYGVAVTAKDLDATQRAKKRPSEDDEAEEGSEDTAKDVREAEEPAEKAATDEAE